MIIQAVAVSDKLVAVWIKTQVPLDDIGAEAVCTSKSQAKMDVHTCIDLLFVFIHAMIHRLIHHSLGPGQEQPGSLLPVAVSAQFGGQGAEIGAVFVPGSAASVWSLKAADPSMATFEAGYYHLTTLKVESLAAAQCQPGSFGLLGLAAKPAQVRSCLGW